MTQVCTTLNTTSLERLPTIHIIGDTLNGGGQLVRLALGLSALIRKPLYLDKIRANRPGNGGLKSQHVAALNFLRDVTEATVVGGFKGSDSVEVSYPNQVRVASSLTTP